MRKAKNNLIYIYSHGQLLTLMGSLCVYGLVSAHLAVNQRETLALVHFSFTVATWLDDTQTMRFSCACWHARQRGAAWQCLTLTRFRVGNQHHEAQLMTELRAGRVCVCVCVCVYVCVCVNMCV